MKPLTKRILTICLAFIFALTPVILTGCLSTNTNPSDSSTGGSISSGGSSSSSNGGGDPTHYDTADYFDGFKTTFRTTGTDEVFVDELYNSVSNLSLELLSDLYSQYGYIIPETGVRYLETDYETEGTTPFMSKDLTLLEERNGTTYHYTADERFSHENAIGKDSPNGEDYLKWNWTYPDGMDDNYYISYIGFIFTSHNKEKLTLAIILMMQGQDVSDLSGTAYANYASVISSFSSMTDEQIETTIKSYCSGITHTGLYADEQVMLNNFILNVIIGDELISLDANRFVVAIDLEGSVANYSETDSAWAFYADEMFYTHDILNSDPNYEIVSYGAYALNQYINFQPYTFPTDLYDDLNQSEAYEYREENNNNPTYLAYYRLTYFKNYVNSVKSILNQYFPENYLDLGVGETAFPLLPAAYFRDYNVADLQMDEESGYFPMATGAQNYKNMVLMPKTTIKLKDIILAVESTQDFALGICLRYHTASGFATWSSGGTQTDLFRVGSYTIRKGKYSATSLSANDFEVDLETILKASSVNGTAKNNCVVGPFVNNSQSFGTSTMLSLSGASSNYFSTWKNQSNGIENIGYDDNAAEYVELVFEANPEVAYKLGILFLYFDEV